ncbi:SoxAX cytochrome complex subunit A [Bradyrhizobium sp. SSBR45G]|uniref:sulfur oxidation c-type cytochrome SoxA n=1 Tax=unclassified Bradyrhizobium TaxID=2631580 RepID=UPI002342B6BC|nr:MULTISPECIES: sulfur oxidation c-type cytochrome SoxA [unclassified Bradyrhizobium]GLH76553.1 SoxAX cytochrome complex subunit A [Bradyrhizobium sp. SSBR45G]GLH84170.1 SoxAX cytochrome complex subunit A [Bradyrhizobium sp. SSBR45R]
MSIRYGSLAVLATAALTLSAIAVFGQEAERKGIPAPPGHVFKTIISGYQFRTKETRALQDDDLENPGFLAVERAADMWKTVDGSEGKSCMSCHGEAETTMKGVGAAMPKWSEKLNKPVNLEQQINICRSEHMKVQPWGFKSKELTDMTTFVRFQSRGMPVAVKTDGPMSPWFEKGKEIYYTRVGQLDLACASCHEKNNGKFMRADFLSQGQTNGFPTYRLRDQRLIPLHERFEGCMFDVRGVPYKPLSDEFLALELYVAWRGIGLPVETPSVRN